MPEKTTDMLPGAPPEPGTEAAASPASPASPAGPVRYDTPMVYVGPTLGRDGLAQYRVFKAGPLPPAVLALAARYPGLSGLMVPVARLTQARADLRRPGHPLQAAAQALLTAYRQAGRTS
ncbi:hypothetical protein JCM14635_04380 [Megalodesulfovibrio paquesii]